MLATGVKDKANPITNNTRKHILECEKYVANLSMMDKYLLWRYTAGSASINTFLIMGTISANGSYWCYLFFKYWKNTSEAQKFPIGQSGAFSQWLEYFKDPESFKLRPSAQVTKSVITTYINELNRVLRNAPKPTGPIMVTKVASKYPGLPAHNAELPVNVKQLPFNSTTIDDGFNFALFVPKDDMGRPLGNNSVMFKLVIPAGATGALYIPDYVHAYSFEKEILLMNDVSFTITAQYLNATIPYVDPSTVAMDKFQPKMSDINMGEVYDVNTYFPCGNRPCMKQILSNVTIYRAKLAS